MPSIQSIPHPLIYKIKDQNKLPELEADKSRISIHTITRSLQGMQKEAIVNDVYNHTAWRMVCDEGPWLNGSDLSSFPLGFFSTGMVACLASELMTLAKTRNIPIETIRIIQDTRYSMNGSAIKKTMKGSALPVETEIMITSCAPQSVIESLSIDALAASPADAIMRNEIASQFRIIHNGKDIDIGNVKPSNISFSHIPADLFDEIVPTDKSLFISDIIKKLAMADISDERNGQAVGMGHEQKRVVEVRSVLSLREDGLKSIQVACTKPEGGSVFNFLSDEPEKLGGKNRAPTGLQYLSAGVAFCFMTQLGRYAAIVKQNLHSYGVVQDTVFNLSGSSSGFDQAEMAEPVQTHVFIDSTEDNERVKTLVGMAEQTCYLHACYRGNAKTKLKINKI